MNRLSLLTIAAITFFSLPALALDLQQAREQLMVGEKADGYIALIAKNSADAEELVKDINARRKSEYQRISKENGQPVDVVARLAAKQIITKLPAGAVYQSADGKWEKK